MLNKKSVKIISIVVLAIVLLMSMGNAVFAAFDIPDASGDVQVSSDLNQTISLVLNIITWGGLIAAVVVAMIIGIKYITASPDGKAEVKKTVMYYVAGIAILLTASTIVRVIASTINKDSVNTGNNNETVIAEIITKA